MQGRDVRITSSHLRWVGSILAAVVLLPVVGQWFIEYATALGLYEHPVERVDAVIIAIAALTSSPLFHWIGGGVLGFALGVWLDAIVRRKETVPQIAAPVVPKPDLVEAFVASRPMTNPPQVSPPPITAPIQLHDLRRAAEAGALANRKKIIRDWSRISSYELYQAASLWAEALPPAVSLMPLTEAAVANLAMLKSAIRRGELGATLDDAASFISRGPTETTCVLREALVEYAEKLGERPAFLFPDG